MGRRADSGAGVPALAWAFVSGPARAWTAIAEGDARPGACAAFLCLMCLLPASGWVLGLLLYAREGAPVIRAPVDAITLGAITWALCASQALLLALVWRLMAPLYVSPCQARDLRHLFAVATYGSTPLLLGGLLLAWPPLMPALLLALLHACVAWREGLRVHAGLRAGDATEAVAIGGLLTAIMSAIGGAIAERLETIIKTTT